MDIARPERRQQKYRRNMVIAAVAVLLVAAVLIYVFRLKPAIPSVDSPVLTDTVARGDLLRQVRAPGTLVPREDRIRLIPAETDATVLRILVLPGAHVTADTELMELGDPATQQQVQDAELQVKAAKADLLNVKARLQSDLMTQRAGAATVAADQHQAALQSQTDKSLYDLGVISGLTYSASKGKADELQERNSLERQRLDLNNRAIATQVAVQQAKVDEAEALLALKLRQSAALQVRAGIDGVLVDLPHQVGERVLTGATLAKVVQPDQLKAALKVPETQARDIQIGEPASIDTHNGVFQCHVRRVDPAVQNGTVTVDVAPDGPLPAGVRPDLSVDGTIDLQHLHDVLVVSRPANGNENSSGSLFRLNPGGKTASRVAVRFGPASVSSIEILSGLHAGDQIVLSDMTRWDSANEVRLSQQ